MLKIVTVMVVLAALGVTVVTPAAYQEYATDPNNPGMCLMSRTKYLMPEDTTLYLPGCKSANCYKRGNDMFIQYFSCGVIDNSDPLCFIHEDKKARYPDCCPILGCA